MKSIIFCFFIIALIFSIYTFPVESPFLVAFNTVWIPNPSWNGGLNTRLTLGRFFNFEYILLQNQTFYARYNSTSYYLNVTGGNNVRITLLNWFDVFGTYFTIDSASNITLFVGSKGAPVKVNGADSDTYFAGNQTLNLEFTSSGYAGIHWNTGSTVRMSNPDLIGFKHSQDTPPQYRTIYGYGIIHGGYYQYGFQTRTFAQNYSSDIETISLSLGNKVNFTLTYGTNLISETDPFQYCQIATELYPEGSGSGWIKYNNATQYLDVGFNIRFMELHANQTIPAYSQMKYEPKLENENATVTVVSTIAGTQSHTMPAIFYVTEESLTVVTPVYVAWEYSLFFIGMGGMFLMMFAGMYGVYKIKHSEIPEGIGWGIVLFIIGACLVAVWLWG